MKFIFEKKNENERISLKNVILLRFRVIYFAQVL